MINIRNRLFIIKNIILIYKFNKNPIIIKTLLIMNIRYKSLI
jgi:hypothetical protein